MREKGFILSKTEGFTLIELVLALAVGSIVLTGAVLSIYSILVTTGRGSDQAVALTDINQAALAIRNDLLMAQATDFVDGVPKSTAELTWTDYTSSFGSANYTSHSSVYALSGKQLRRTYDGTTSIVGRNVVAISFTQSTEFAQDANRVKVAVTISTNNTTSPSQLETVQFSVHLRPEEVQ